MSAMAASLFRRGNTNLGRQVFLEDERYHRLVKVTETSDCDI